MQDWDLLFNAVTARLLSSFDNIPTNDTALRRRAWSRTRARVMECVQALDQLHLAATHELARVQPPATDDVAPAMPAQGGEASTGSPPQHDDPVQAILQARHDHLCDCGRLSEIREPQPRPRR